MYNVMSSRGPHNPVVCDISNEDTVSDSLRDLKSLGPSQENGECYKHRSLTQCHRL